MELGTGLILRAAPATPVRSEDVFSIGAPAVPGITRQRLTRPSNGVDRRRFTTLPRMSSRFEERLRTGPPIVADGGMGTLLSGAVPRLRCPEEANLRAPESVVAFHASFIRAGAELIETNTFGANRRKLAAHFLEDELERINSTAVRLAREAREVSGARRLHRRLDRAARRGGALRRRAEHALRRAGADARGTRRRPAHARDVLRPGRARRRDRRRPLGLVAAGRRADDLRRGRPDARRRLRRRRGRPAGRAGRRRRGREPQRRPGGGA